MIHVTDLSLLKITRVKPWSICFDYDNKHYLIHGSYECGEGSWQVLYERQLNEFGKYNLIYLKNVSYASNQVADDYIKKQRGKTIVYRNINKEYFAYKLTKRGFATGIFEEDVRKAQEYINKIEKQIKDYQNKIWQLNCEIAGLR